MFRIVVGIDDGDRLPRAVAGDHFAHEGDAVDAIGRAYLVGSVADVRWNGGRLRIGDDDGRLHATAGGGNRPGGIGRARLDDPMAQIGFGDRGRGRHAAVLQPLDDRASPVRRLANGALARGRNSRRIQKRIHMANSSSGKIQYRSPKQIRLIRRMHVSLLRGPLNDNNRALPVCAPTPRRSQSCQPRATPWDTRPVKRL